MSSKQAFFHYAKSGDVDGVRRFLAKGEDVNTRDAKGDTPVVVAYIGYCNAQYHSMPLDNHYDVIKLLCESGADVNIKNMKEDCRKSLLMAVAASGLLEVVKLLLEYGAEINAQNKQKSTPLMYAINDGHLEVCRFLVEKGAEVNARDENGSTPLMYAAMRGFRVITACLCAAGAELELESQQNFTALTLAMGGAFQETVQVLCDYGAVVNLENENVKIVFEMLKACDKRDTVELLERKDFARRVGLLLLSDS